MSYNILDGGVGRADPVAEVLEAQRADVVVLVEATGDWVTQRIARRLRMEHVTAWGRPVERRVDAVAVLSRWPVVRSVNHGLLLRDGPRAMVEAELAAPNGGTLTVVGLHLSPRATPAAEADRVRQLRRVLAVTAALREAGRPHVLAGDFNANAPTQRIDAAKCKASTRKAMAENGGVPRAAVQLLLDAGYVDSLAAAIGSAASDAATFTTHEPGQRVDYVFTHGVTPTHAWIEADRLATYASDHYPVGAECPT